MSVMEKIYAGPFGLKIEGPVTSYLNAELDHHGNEKKLPEETFGNFKVITDPEGMPTWIDVNKRFPENSLAILHFYRGDGTAIKGRRFYRDADGAFALIEPISETNIVYNVPYGAFDISFSGIYFVRLTAIEYSGPNGRDSRFLGRYYFQTNLYYKENLNILPLIEPLVALCMEVVRADNIVKPEEISMLRDFFSETFHLTEKEALAVRDMMKETSGESIDKLVEKCLFKLPRLYNINIFKLLTEVAKADGHIDDSEAELIRETALKLGVKELQIDDVLGSRQERQERTEDIYYRVLDLNRGCTEEEVKAAFRQKAAMYHPDKVTHMAVEFQELAHNKFTEIQQAYDAVMKDF